MELRYRSLMSDRRLAIAIGGAKQLSAFEKWQMFEASFRGESSGEQVLTNRAQIVEKMVQSDAEAAVGAISASQTPQAIAGLSEAVKAWYAYDAVAAEQWYRANGSALAAAQRDAVSSTFFNLALGFAEYDTAAAWLDQVADAKLKSDLSEKLAQSHK